MHTHNGLKTVALLGLLSALVLVLGGALGGTGGLTIAVIFALGINAFAYFCEWIECGHSPSCSPVAQ